MTSRSAALLLALAGCSARATAPAKVAEGARLWAQYCALCHGAHAEGYVADNAPALASATFRETASDYFLKSAIERGRPGTAMAGYAQSLGGPLDPARVDALIAFLRDGGPEPRQLPYQPPGGNAANGASLFAARCATCHGTPERRGNAVHLANPVLLETATDAFLRDAVIRGRPGTRMEAWGTRLSATQVDDVIAHLRSLARPAPPAAPFSAPTPRPNSEPIPQAALQPQAPPQAGPAPQLAGPVVLNPHGRPPDFTLREDLYVPVAQAARAFDEKRRMIILDARPPPDFLRMHIPGAVSLPYYDLRSVDQLPNDGTWVIAYCACPHHLSGVVIDELRRRGFQHTAVLDEGIFVWQQAGHPMTVAEGQLPTPAPPPR